jgi:hypothetical protein
MRGPRPVAWGGFSQWLPTTGILRCSLLLSSDLLMQPEADCQGKTASLCDKTIDRKVKPVIHFASSLKATAPEIAPGAFLCWSDTRQWVMEAGYFQTRPDTHQ